MHADDVAQALERVLSRPAAIGASFHVVAEQAMTQRGLAAGVARWFGRDPVLDFVDWAEFTRRAGPEHAEVIREHTLRSIAASIARARKVLQYAPRYSSLQALHEALAWLVANGQADVGGQPFPASTAVSWLAPYSQAPRTVRTTRACSRMVSVPSAPGWRPNPQYIATPKSDR